MIMCGILGFLSSKSAPPPTVSNLNRMLDAVGHRGPDGCGTWISQNGRVGLGHTRLSIVGMGDSGAQPMQSYSGRYVISLNGEIYNHEKIRADLVSAGIGFSGTSDTEAFLNSIDCYGLDSALESAFGMFAFALYDRMSEIMILGRDRVGEKPLYYSANDGIIIFGSELPVLQASGYFDNKICRDALTDLIDFGFIPAPHSIFESVKKLPAGTLLTCSEKGAGWEPQLRRWWSLDELAIHDNEPQRELSEDEVVNKFDRTIHSVVREQISADVPVGSLLSGGVDSTIVTIAASKMATGPISTFTAGYKEDSHDESVNARRVAQYLGTDHHEMIISENDGLNAIIRLADIYSEPFADYSQIPTSLICNFVRKDMKAVLAGDGADEFFSGYNRYLWGPRILRLRQFLGTYGSEVSATALRSLSAVSWHKILQTLPQSLRPPQVGDKVHRVADLLRTKDPEIAYNTLLRQWRGPSPVIGGENEPIPERYSHYWTSGIAFSRIMQYIDAQTYLPDDILVKTDRASMAVGLEVRSPFLDPRMLHFALSLPTSFLLRGNKSKWILRKWLERHIPTSLIDRPKSGFSFPLATWLRGPLRQWASDKLDKERIDSEGFFNSDLIAKKWATHLKGDRNNHSDLWPILMFQSWLEAFRDAK